MFGWEFPPHISGGLAVACKGLSQAMAAQGADIIFVLPHRLKNLNAPWLRFVFADDAYAVSGGTTTCCAHTPWISAYASSQEYREWLKTNAHLIVPGTRGDTIFEEVTRYAKQGGAVAARESFDVIYAHDWLTFGAGIEAKRVSGKPLVIQVHSTVFDRSGGKGIDPDVYEVEKAGMMAADAIIAISQFQKDIIVQKYGIPEEKVVIVYNGIGIDDSTTAVSKNRLGYGELKKQGKKLVLFLGRLSGMKGPDYFLTAAKRVLEYNPDVKFIMIGKGDMDSYVRNMAKELGIERDVIFAGFLQREDANEAFSSADLYVMPSVSEPFGLVALEAMKIGTPVIMSKQSGVAEAAQHVLKVDYWDTDEMANKILSVVGYPALGQTLSQNAGAEVQNFTWDIAATKVNAVIEKVAG